MKPKLTAALRAIIGRSDEIVALAENDEQNLPEIFSFRQNNITIKACLEAVDAGEFALGWRGERPQPGKCRGGERKDARADGGCC